MFDHICHVFGQLPNRLGKMLAPLHWHDYKTKYGKVDDFVATHPDVLSLSYFISSFDFLIDVDYLG